MDAEKGIYYRLPLSSVLFSPDDVPQQGGTVKKHVLARRRRAEAERLPPVGKGVIVALLLEVVLVVGKVLDALGAVLSIFSLSGNIDARQEHRNAQNCQS